MIVEGTGNTKIKGRTTEITKGMFHRVYIYALNVPGFFPGATRYTRVLPRYYWIYPGFLPGITGYARVSTRVLLDVPGYVPAYYQHNQVMVPEHPRRYLVPST